jgi:hypothetical protein
MPLDPDKIRSIYAKRRTKGGYDEKLVEFMTSGDAGISVREQWNAEFAWNADSPDDAEGKSTKGKTATTLKQGFENAKDRKGAPNGSEHIDVIVDEDEVYLINKMVTEGLQPLENSANGSEANAPQAVESAVS